MDKRNIFFWAIIVLIVFFLFRLSVYERRSTVENATSSFEPLDSGPPAISNIYEQSERKQRHMNQLLFKKCIEIFGGDNKFLEACTDTTDGYLTYYDGIERAYDIYIQNQKDVVFWGPHIYFDIIRGNTENIICQAVYINDPEMQAICLNSPEYKKHEMWIEYWDNRRQKSLDWNLLPSRIQPRLLHLKTPAP